MGFVVAQSRDYLVTKALLVPDSREGKRDVVHTMDPVWPFIRYTDSGRWWDHGAMISKGAKLG